MKTVIKNLLNKKAFTMVELLVAMSIFMVFVALSAGSYIGLMKANRLASETQRTYRDVRHVFDTFADEVHNYQIDYNCFAQGNGDPDCIQNGSTPSVVGFINNDGQYIYRRLYFFSDNTIKVKKQIKSPNDFAWRDMTSAPESLTSAETKFSGVSFSIFPNKNPYDADNLEDASVQWQPSLTISILKEGKTPGTIQEYRTTFSSRSYGTKSLYTPLL